MPKTLTIELLKHTQEVSASDIAEVILGTADTLKEISNEISNDEGLINDWKVTKITMESPFKSSFVMFDKSRENIALETGKRFILGQRIIEESGKAPEYFNEKITKNLIRIHEAKRKISGNGSAIIRFTYPGVGDITSSNKLDENLIQVYSLYTRGKYSEWTSLRGMLDTVGGKSAHKRKGKKGPCFNLYVKLYNKDIPCFFNELQFEQIRNLLEIEPVYLSVYGKVKFNAKGQPLAVEEVEHYRKLLKPVKEKNIDDIRGLNITNGEDTSEYIQRVRYGVDINAI